MTVKAWRRRRRGWRCRARGPNAPPAPLALRNYELLAQCKLCDGGHRQLGRFVLTAALSVGDGAASPGGGRHNLSRSPENRTFRVLTQEVSHVFHIEVSPALRDVRRRDRGKSNHRLG